MLNIFVIIWQIKDEWFVYLSIPWVPAYHRSDRCIDRDVAEPPKNLRIPRWPCSGKEAARCARNRKRLSEENNKETELKKYKLNRF